MIRLLLLAVCLLPSVAIAKPTHKQSLIGHLGEFLPEKLNRCQLCHLNDPAKEGVEPTRNPFGERLEAVKDTLKEAKKPFDIPARFKAIAGDDSDGDGSSNLVEILVGRAPGDATDRPTAEELVASRKTVAKYEKSLAAYPWKPYEIVKRPPLPTVGNAEWALNPIDSFVAAEHEERELTPRPEADRATLLRRVTLDLTGLPPTPEELRAFLDDPSPRAYENVVERLLDSPRYGERWGRHWMDVWRYSDWAGWTDGNSIRDSQPHVWRWRDWIVESLNADKGYDRMILEMLAGDEIAPEDPETLRATGFLVRNFKALSREKWLQDTVDHTFMAFQATTVGCARCHDHMFDPIPQKEYYQLRAIFEPHQVRLDRVPGERDPMKAGLARAYDANLNAPTYLYERGDERHPDQSAAMVPGVVTAFGLPFGNVGTVRLPLTAVSPDRRAFVIRDELAFLESEVTRTRNASPTEAGLAVAKRDSFRATVEAEWRVGDSFAAKEATTAQRTLALATANFDLAVAEAALAKDPKSMPLIKKRDDAKTALTKAEALNALPPSTEFMRRTVPTFPAESTGRRTALANWLANRDNPLTARVAVNHLWLRHFGQAIVPSVFDFGKNGRKPTHPALLDWLAAELMENHWQMKPLHRLMVTSRTYRLASTPDATDLSRDPDNLYLWRFAPRRLEAEAVRDQLLFVSGALDEKMTGPDLDPNRGLDLPRRSLYFRHAHEKQMEFLKLFDAAGTTECYQRRDSIVPQQALSLVNSPLSMESAKRLAKQLFVRGDEEGLVRSAFERILNRPPTREEITECVSFLRGGSSPERQGVLFLQAMLNHHEFVTLR